MVGKTVNKSVDRALFEITPEIQHFAGLCEKNNAIDKELRPSVRNRLKLTLINSRIMIAFSPLRMKRTGTLVSLITAASTTVAMT